jgi:hypothetical protein
MKVALAIFVLGLCRTMSLCKCSFIFPCQGSENIDLWHSFTEVILERFCPGLIRLVDCPMHRHS